MKKFTLLFLCAVSGSTVVGMEEVAEFSLSSEEDKYYEWYDTQKEKHAPTLWQNISPQMKNALHGQSTENELKEAIGVLVGGFYEKLKESSVETPYSQDSIVDTLLKMRIAMREKKVIKATGLATARMYAFTHLLTSEQKATVSEESYLNNPAATDEAMKCYAGLLTNELVKLELVEDSLEARAESIQFWHTKKMTELRLAYEKHS